MNRLITASQQWNNNPCPQLSQIFEKEAFEQGDPIVFSIHFRHNLTSDDTDIRAVEPDGDVNAILNLNYVRGGNFHSTNPSAWWSRTIPANAELGKWTLEADYNTTTYGLLQYEQEFWVASSCVANRVIGGVHTLDRYYQASNTITSTADIQGSTHVVYNAENVTTLNPGFSAPSGCKLEIKTTGCN